jgi:serine phosphatase RsbU (regulator of sigma subunit)
MRKTFQKWLFVFVIVAFILTLCLSFYLQTQEAHSNSVSLIDLKLEDATKQIERNTKNVETIRIMTESEALSKARALAEIVANNPDVLDDEGWPVRMKKILDIDDVHIIEKNGIIIASSSAVGYDMASNEQSKPFLEGITNPDFQFVQKVQPRGLDGKMFQYAGVARIDQPGVVQIGYFPNRLTNAMNVADIKNLADGFRIGNNGSIITTKSGTIVSAADEKSIGKRIDTYGIQSGNLNKKEPFYATIESTKYICKARLYSPYILLGILPVNEMYVSRNEMVLSLIVSNTILFTIVFFLVSFLVDKVVISGIFHVNHSLKKITEGDLDEQVNVRSNYEFTSLSDGINSTVSALKKAISEAAARIDKELEFAREIQLSSLPTVFPPYPDRTEFDIFAAIYTAKEVGGDFYDFFMVDDDHLVVLVADVSGKGIPAALFMMTSKTMINNLAESGRSPSEIFNDANKHLFENNEAEMFVTAFLGILEISTGKFTYVNAGHNKPLIRHSDFKYEWINTKPGFVLAGLDSTQYSQAEIMLNPGDSLFLYTDGVTEAMNYSEEMFGNNRLLELLNSEKGKVSDPVELIKIVKKEIDLFSAETQQADDITLLALKYKGAGKS